MSNPDIPETTIDTQDGTISISAWVRRGGMFVNRDALDWDDPDHKYNVIKSFGIDPAKYGIAHPKNKEFEGWSRQGLIDEIIELRKQIESIARAGFL